IALGQVAADKSGGTNNTKIVIKTLGAVMQNHLFGDRLVTTFGLRHDETYTKFGFAGNPTNAFLNPDGRTFNYDLINAWAPTYFENGGHTTNVQFVARPFTRTPITSSLGKNGGAGKFLGDVLDGLSLSYNRSDSFLPLVPAQDLFKRLLPNPTGTDKSCGAALNLFDGKLVVRATHFDNWQRNAQTNDMSTMAGRVLRVDFQTTGAGNPTPFLNLHDNAIRWVTFANPGMSADQVNTQVANITKISTADAAFYANAAPPIGATSDVHSV
ncbi:MAG: TonB-dependent receptor, partial [Opitutus sp.]